MSDKTYSVRVDETERPTWDALIDSFEDATVYQTRSYGEVHWSARQLSHFVLERDGGPVVAAQIRIVRLPLIRRGVAYLRWGPLCRVRGAHLDEDGLRHALEAIRDEYGRRRGLLVRVIPHVFENEPCAEAFRRCLGEAGFAARPDGRKYRTIRLNLEPSLDVLRKGLAQKWRNQLNAAEKNNLDVQEGTGADLYGIFLGLYEDMMGRKRFRTSVDVREFQNIQSDLPDGLKMRILVCRAEGRPVSALVGSAMGENGIYLLGATSTEGTKWKGSYLLQWRMIQWLKETGRRRYDLGGINPEENPGVYHFKKGLSGDDTQEIGQYEYAPSAAARNVMKVAEGLQGLARRIRPGVF
jgi:lipid II:glycine glycyltransferase (peptidoglycan interpeptide bridge formation enzyme)